MVLDEPQEPQERTAPPSRAAFGQFPERQSWSQEEFKSVDDMVLDDPQDRQQWTSVLSQMPVNSSGPPSNEFIQDSERMAELQDQSYMDDGVTTVRKSPINSSSNESDGEDAVSWAELGLDDWVSDDGTEVMKLPLAAPNMHMPLCSERWA